MNEFMIQRTEEIDPHVDIPDTVAGEGSQLQ